jgi:hypothetical protein
MYQPCVVVCAGEHRRTYAKESSSLAASYRGSLSHRDNSVKGGNVRQGAAPVKTPPVFSSQPDTDWPAVGLALNRRIWATS